MDCARCGTCMNRVALNRSVVVPVFIALLALSMSGCERAKTRLDREVDRLCAVDGGVHIYETVKLSKEKYCSATLMLAKTAEITFEIAIVEAGAAAATQ